MQVVLSSEKLFAVEKNGVYRKLIKGSHFFGGNPYFIFKKTRLHKLYVTGQRYMGCLHANPSASIPIHGQ